MKLCTRCGLPGEFSSKKAECKPCNAARSKAWRKKNPDKVLALKRAAYARNPQAKVESVRQWRLRNPDKYLEQIRRRMKRCGPEERKRLREWKRANSEKVREAGRLYRQRNPSAIAERTRRSQAARRRAVPKWADHDAMEAVYAQARTLTAQTGVPHEVDHIVPLTSDVVCGLHWEGNLQILTRAANRAKRNYLLAA